MERPVEWVGAWATPLFRLALLCQPRWVRDAYGGEMEMAFAEGLRGRRGLGARLSFAARGLADVVASGLRERRRGEPLPDGRSIRGRGDGMMNGEGWTDLRVALRSLRRAPGFTLAAVLMLALGIGANTALFSAIRDALLTAPPFPEPDRIALLDLTDSSSVNPAPATSIPWSYPKYGALAAATDLPLVAVGAYAVRNLTLTGAGDATVLPVEVATPGYFDVLGVSVDLGRGFSADDDREGATPVALMSNELWTSRFGAAADLVGRDVMLNGQPVTIVGILPTGFRGLTGVAQLWVTPHGGAQLITPILVRAAQAHWMQAVGRMSPEATLESLRDRMRAVGQAAEAVAPDSDPTAVRGGSARGLMEVRVGERARRSLMVLSLASALLLVVACANLAGLLIARATARRRESAVRAALGAGRWRVARGLLAESSLLALMGGAASILVAWMASNWLATAWPTRSLSDAWNVDVVSVGGGRIDLGALAFAGGLSVVVGLVLGVAPALRSGRTRPGAHLREGPVGDARGSSGGLRGALVAGEIALALVLIVGAGLLLRSMQELQAVDRGYRPGNLLTFNVQAPRGSAWADDLAGFHELVQERLAGLPSIEAVGMGCVAPVSGHCMITGVRRAGERTWPEGSRAPVGVHYVSDAYFSTLDVPVRRGRTFDSRDQRGSTPVVVLSERAARELFPDGDALGQPMAMGVSLTPSDSEATAEVVGVVADVLYNRPDEGPMAEIYISHRQEDSYGAFVLRTRADPLTVIPAVRAAVREIEPDAPLVSMRTLADVEANAMSDTRLLGFLLAAFAGLALLLACTGVWAAVAFTVSRRTREFGLRLALGARPGQVVASVVRRGLVTAGLGVALGLAAAWYGSRILETLLFEVGVGDPFAFGGGALALLAVATLAAWLPARRATRVDPVESLRAE